MRDKILDFLILPDAFISAFCLTRSIGETADALSAGIAADRNTATTTIKTDRTERRVELIYGRILWTSTK